MRVEPSRLKKIFLSALEKGAEADQASFLDDACAGDAEVRRGVEAMLLAHGRHDRLLDRPAAEHLVGTDHATPDFLEPSTRPGSLGRLGDHEALEVVGRGGMGIVLRAFDEKLHRIVAIKALIPVLAVSGAARQRFLREARAAAAVTHDNVIAIHAVEDAGPVPYIVMQFIDGCTLQQKLDRVGPMPLKEILRLGIQIADGLAAAHRHGLVHRDVKPANILLENGVERVKITDFGLARTADDASLTQSGVITGTPAYMSPEQANGEKVDHRSDLFSLGSVLYALCTGHPPFRAGTALAVLKRVCDETPRQIREINPDIPQWLASVVTRLHAKEPSQRFATATEVALLLNGNLARLQAGADINDPLSPIVVPPDRPDRRGKRLVGVAPVVFASVASIALTSAWLGRDSRLPIPPMSQANIVTPSEPLSWKPRPLLTADMLARIPDPLDAWQHEAVPATLISNMTGSDRTALPELVGILGGEPFRLPQRGQTHWPTQSPDGGLLALPCGKTVVLYDATSGKVIRILKGHTGHTFMGDFSSNGKRYACGSVNGVVKVWDVATGDEDLSLRDGSNHVWTTLFSPDNTRILTGGVQGAVKVWDAASGREMATIGQHDGGAACMTFNPDGTRLATAGLDGVVRVWDWPSGRLMQSLEGHPDIIQSITFNTDGTLLASGSQSRVIVWDASSLQRRHSLETAGGGMLGFTPDGQTLLAASHSLISGQMRGFTRWDVKTGIQSAALEVPGPPNVLAGRLSRDGRTVFMMSYAPPEARLGAFDAVSGADRFANQGHTEQVWSVAFSPDGQVLATGGIDGRVCLWDLKSRPGGVSPETARVFSGSDRRVWAVAFNPDGQLLASLSADSARVWDVASGTVLHELATGPSPEPRSLAFSPDGGTVAAGSEDGSVNLWDVKTGKRLNPLRWHVGPVRTIAFSADGRWLASGGVDKTVQLIDRASGSRSHTFHTGPLVTCLSFSPDSQTLAATSDSSGPSVRLWDLATMTERKMTRKTQPAVALAFHPAGDRIATESPDASIRLLETSTEDDRGRTFEFHQIGPSSGLAYSPSGRHLAVGLSDGLIAILRPLPRSSPR